MSTATKDLQAGAELPGYTIHAKNVQARENRPDAMNIHDDTTATKLGFKRGFVAGGQNLGWLSKMLIGFFGPSYYQNGHFECTYVSPVFDDDDIKVAGVVRERIEEANGVRLVCDVWLEKEDGTRPVVGMASGLVS